MSSASSNGVQSSSSVLANSLRKGALHEVEVPQVQVLSVSLSFGTIFINHLFSDVAFMISCFFHSQTDISKQNRAAALSDWEDKAKQKQLQVFLSTFNCSKMQKMIMLN